MTALAVARRVEAGAGWRQAAVVLAATVLLLLLLFAPDLRAMASLWWTSSSYEHCLLVPPIVAALAWSRRRELSGLTPTGWGPGVLLMVVPALVWLVGAVAGAAVLRQAGLVGMLVSSAMAVLGPAVARGLAFPLGYLLFLVPVGEAWEPPLQLLTARWAGALLHLSGIPAVIDGVFIRTPAGLFEVAEACSGVKFLLAMIALAVLAADLGFRSWRRRALLIACALVLPVGANALRAWGTMAIAERIGAARAGGFDHIVYGWFFFAAVIAAMLAAAWPFFDRDPLAPAFDPDRLARMRVPGRCPPLLAAAACLVVASGASAWAAAVDTRVPAPLARANLLPTVPGWTFVGPLNPEWQPRFAGADRLTGGRFRDALGEEVTVVVAAYARQTRAVSAVGYGQGATPPGSGWTWNGALPRDAIRIAGPDGIQRDVLERFAIGPVVTASEGRLKLEALRRNLLGQSSATAVVMVSADERQGGLGAVERFARAMGPLDRLARAPTVR